MKYLITFSLLFLFQFSFSQTSIQGTVTDAETGEPIIFGTVALYKNGKLYTGGETDLAGFYSISEIEGGFYDVEFSYTGYLTKKRTYIFVGEGKIKLLDERLSINNESLESSIIRILTIPIIRQDELTQGFSFSAEEIRRMPHRN